jgi:hypothetical protein
MLAGFTSVGEGFTSYFSYSDLRTSSDLNGDKMEKREPKLRCLLAADPDQRAEVASFEIW